MRVLVTGSRNWDDQEFVWQTLDYCYVMHVQDDDTLTVAHGDCPSGADRHAKEWCESAIESGRRVLEEPHPANWEFYGKRAGFKRNTDMARLGAGVCLAFVRDGSRGARHCAGQAKIYGIPVARFDWGSR